VPKNCPTLIGLEIPEDHLVRLLFSCSIIPRDVIIVMQTSEITKEKVFQNFASSVCSSLVFLLEQPDSKNTILRWFCFNKFSLHIIYLSPSSFMNRCPCFSELVFEYRHDGMILNSCCVDFFCLLISLILQCAFRPPLIQDFPTRNVGFGLPPAFSRDRPSARSVFVHDFDLSLNQF